MHQVLFTSFESESEKRNRYARKTFKLKNGTKVVIRLFKKEDSRLIEELYHSLSSETKRHRFFGIRKYISEDINMLKKQVEQGLAFIVVAVINKNRKPEMIGDARLYLNQEKNEAEFAIVVTDSWQGLGLGKKMSGSTLELAKKIGINKVYAYTFVDNKWMLRIFEGLGFLKLRRDDHFFLEKTLLSK